MGYPHRVRTIDRWVPDCEKRGDYNMVDNTVGGPGVNPALRTQIPVDRQDAVQRRQGTESNTNTSSATSAAREEAIEVAGGASSELSAARAISQTRAQDLAERVLNDGSAPANAQGDDPFLAAVIESANAAGFGPVDAPLDQASARDLALAAAESLGGGDGPIGNSNPAAIGRLLS